MESRSRSDKKVLKWIWRVAGAGRRWISFSSVVKFLQSACTIVYAYLLRTMIDYAAVGNGEAFFQYLVVFSLLVVLTIVLQTTGRYVVERTSAVLEKSYRAHMFDELMVRDYARISKIHTGEWMNRLTSDTQVVITGMTTIIPETVGYSVRIVGALVSLAIIAPAITAIIVPAGAVMMVFSYLLRSRMKRYHKDVQESDDRIRSFIQEHLNSLLVVRTFTQEKAAREKSGELMDERIRSRIRRNNFSNMCSTCVSVAMIGAQTIGIGLCSWGILNGTISYGTMSAVVYLVNLLEVPLIGIATFVSTYFSMVASAERCMELEEYPLDQEREPRSQKEAVGYYEEGFASLGLDDVTFAYEEGGEPVLDGLSMDVGRGEFVAFTGASGCGKSTTMKVMLSLYPLLGGRTYLRDVSGEEHPLDASWRRLFAYVPQGNQLLAGTVREALTFGDPELMDDEEAIDRALEVACADGFVSELPDGLDTVLGERGAGLSEGQMQRISIARAILSGRPILLLDECTSALDGDTERRLLENLKTMTDRTVITITHRPAVLDYCDKRIEFGR